MCSEQRDSIFVSFSSKLIVYTWKSKNILFPKKKKKKKKKKTIDINTHNCNYFSLN